MYEIKETNADLKFFFHKINFWVFYDLESVYIRSDQIGFAVLKSKCLHVSVAKGEQGSENKALNYKL